jgi:hypothetical protein
MAAMGCGFSRSCSHELRLAVEDGLLAVSRRSFWLKRAPDYRIILSATKFFPPLFWSESKPKNRSSADPVSLEGAMSYKYRMPKRPIPWSCNKACGLESLNCLFLIH